MFGGMRKGVVLSSILHTAIIVVFAFGIPSFITPPRDVVIPVELVILEEEVEIDEPEPEPEPEPKAEKPAPIPEPPPVEARAVIEPEPPAPEPEPEVAPEPEPEVVPPAPEAKPEPVVEPEPKKASPPPPKPRRRPEIKMAAPKTPPKPRQRDQLTSILRNVEKLREQPPTRPQREQLAQAETAGTPTRTVSVFEQNEMVRAIQQQLRRCWRLDPGALRADDQVVEVSVALNPDGSVRKVKIVDVVRMVQDGYFRSAAENAKRAIHQCSPFRLPPRKYQVWRQLTLRFNPREMFGT